MASDLLGNVPLFAKLPEEERAGLTALMRAREFAPNQPVMWIGEQGDQFYVVQSGKVSVSCPDESGKEVILASLASGQFFGEISLLDGGPRTATVRATAATVLLTLERDDFLAFLEKNPKAAVHMLTVLGRRQRETLEKVRGIKNVNDAMAEIRTTWNIVAERIANLTATQWFVMFNLGFCAVWIIINLFLKKPFDEPPTFGVLGLMLTCEALFISLFVLISQSQQGIRDRVRADMDYQVNLKAHQEVMQLHHKVDRLHTVISPPAESTPAADRSATGNGGSAQPDSKPG